MLGQQSPLCVELLLAAGLLALFKMNLASRKPRVSQICSDGVNCRAEREQQARAAGRRCVQEKTPSTQTSCPDSSSRPGAKDECCEAKGAPHTCIAFSSVNMMVCLRIALF